MPKQAFFNPTTQARVQLDEQEAVTFQGGSQGDPFGGLIRSGFQRETTPPVQNAAPVAPVQPNATEQLVGGSDRIREGQSVVRADANKMLSEFDTIQQLRQTTADSGLKRIEDAINNTKRLLGGQFTPDEQAQIDAEKESARLMYEPAIGRAKESARQGVAKSTVFAGERGGFMNTQFAGQSALTPTEGDNFVGRGGELSRIKGELESNIATLEAEQARAILAAQAAAKQALITGNRQSLEDAAKFAEAADRAAVIKEEAITKRIDLLNTMEQNERSRVEFAQGQEDRQLSKLQEFAELGVDNIPAEFASQIEARYGTGFVSEYLTAQRLAKEEGNEIAAMDKITQILARVPDGQSVKIGDATYEGFKTSTPNTRTFSETDAGGNVTYVTIDEKTGEILSQASGGRIGKPVSSSGNNNSGEDEDKEIQAFREDAADLIEKIDTEKVPWSAAFDQLRVKYPQASNELINETLGGGIPYDSTTNSFDTAAAYGRAVAKKK